MYGLSKVMSSHNKHQLTGKHAALLWFRLEPWRGRCWGLEILSALAVHQDRITAHLAPTELSVLAFGPLQPASSSPSGPPRTTT